MIKSKAITCYNKQLLRVQYWFFLQEKCQQFGQDSVQAFQIVMSRGPKLISDATFYKDFRPPPQTHTHTLTNYFFSIL